MNDSNKTSTLTAHVVDPEGNPVAGALVRPFGFRTKEEPSSHYSWEADCTLPQAPITDATGTATIVYPLNGPGEFHLGIVTVMVHHPDFCLDQAELDVANPHQIILKRGTELTLKGIGNESLVLYADISETDPQHRPRPSTLFWTRLADDTLSTHIPSGTYAVRAIGLTKDGATWFSAPQEFHPEGTAFTLRLALSPGRSFSGVLDETTSRSIRNGRIIAEILTEEGPLKSSWLVSAPIGEDRTFMLKDIPQGRIGVIAVCDGFISLPTNASTHVHTPQFFSTTTPEPILVKMTPTGTAHLIILDPDGKPLPKVTVDFFPNQNFSHGNSVLGALINSIDVLQRQGKPFADLSTTTPETLRLYHALTDESGIVTIPNLPAGTQAFHLHHPDCEMPLQFHRGWPERLGRIDITASTTTEKTLTLEKNGTSSLSEAIKARTQHT